ncbi:MAG: 16S rRNA (cytosine(1402)-N(4))-methyltransferase RsmH [Calditrichaeota bacterium]|nr:16S rRNA (cytosine(1402)-N(4))-methyltransferase RsmH [Calditrichota bacterium]
MSSDYHQPVMLRQAVELLVTRPEGIYVDCTLGGGGHSAAILQQLNENGRLIGLDADPDAIEAAGRRLAGDTRFRAEQAFSDQLEVVLMGGERMLPIDGVLYDLGISSYQIDQPARGFAFRHDAPLDMRFDKYQKRTAATVLNTYSETDLAQVIRQFGEERHWRAIARDIVAFRNTQELSRNEDLIAIVRNVVGERHLNKSLARVFQALRIEVNRELERLEASLEQAFRSLREGGRLVVISYHSLEDRIVKRFFKEKARDCICPPGLPVCDCDKVQEVRLVIRGSQTPDEAEIAANPRARSARIRAAAKTVPYRKLS